MQWYDSLARRSQKCKACQSGPSLLRPLLLSPSFEAEDYSRLTESFVPRIPNAKNPSLPEKPAYITTPELLAIRGQRSAASLPTGPVMAEPFISPLGLTIWRVVSVSRKPEQHSAGSQRAAANGWPSVSPSARKTTYHTSVVLEVEEDTVEALPGLGLADDDGGVDLLPELGLALLDCGHHHVADTASGQPVEAGTDALDGDDVQVPRARVVTAVHDGTAVCPLASRAFQRSVSSIRVAAIDRGLVFGRAETGSHVHWETQGHLELATGGTTPVTQTLAERNSNLPAFLDSCRMRSAAALSVNLPGSLSDTHNFPSSPDFPEHWRAAVRHLAVADREMRKQQ